MFLVVEGDLGDLLRHGECDVEIADRQKVGPPCSKPVTARLSLALWTMPVAAGIIGDTDRVAVLALLDMPAEASGRHISIALMTRYARDERRVFDDIVLRGGERYPPALAPPPYEAINPAVPPPASAGITGWSCSGSSCLTPSCNVLFIDVGGSARRAAGRIQNLNVDGPGLVPTGK